jgi:hypothetical protein
MLAVFGTVLWFAVKWTLILSWRFFSGDFMNGKPRNDATWWQDASRRYQKQRRKYTWWNRKSRMKRASWRHGVFWPCLGLSVGFGVDPWGTLFVLGMLSPGLYFFGRQRIRLMFWIPIAGTHSDGVTYQHWILKPKVRLVLDKLKPDYKRGRKKYPGLLPDPEKRGKGPMVTDIPLEYANAVRAEVLDQYDTNPPIELKLLLDPEIDMLELGGDSIGYEIGRLRFRRQPPLSDHPPTPQRRRVTRGVAHAVEEAESF